MTDPEPAVPSTHDLARISYAEVLDATKHQDDKIGRLLAAVAFLTGGALVFTTRDILQAHYVLGDHEYRLTALLLGAFLVLDLVAVVLWILTMQTPLTKPGTSTPDKSFLFFHVIATMPVDEWKQKWSTDDLVKGHTKDLIDEAHNLARRANGKYVRSELATRIFLASVILLVPTLVLSIDSVSGPGPAPAQAGVLGTAQATSPSAPGFEAQDAVVPIPWTIARRALVALPVAAVVLALGLWQWWVPAPRKPESEEPDPEEPVSTIDRREKRTGDLLGLALAQAMFVAITIFGTGGSTAWMALVLALVLASGAFATSKLVDMAVVGSDAQEPRLSVLGTLPRPPQLTVAIAFLLTVAGIAAIGFEQPALQLFVAIVAACLVPLASFESGSGK